MTLNPPTQYATDANLRARQRFWQHQHPRFDIVGWVIEIAGLTAAGDHEVLDVGCGNGAYLSELRRRHISAVGCDLSFGMLSSIDDRARLVTADVARLPFRSDAFDVIVAPHMLYHVEDRPQAARELRRVLRPDGRGVVVTNGRDHLRSLRVLVEIAVRAATPGWEMRNPATHAFSLENGESQLRSTFQVIDVVRPVDYAPVRITDAAVAADYVASVADHYRSETTRPWNEVVDEVRTAVQQHIDDNGAYFIAGDTGAFVCQ